MSSGATTSAGREKKAEGRVWMALMAAESYIVSTQNIGKAPCHKYFIPSVATSEKICYC